MFAGNLRRAGPFSQAVPGATGACAGGAALAPAPFTGQCPASGTLLLRAPPSSLGGRHALSSLQHEYLQGVHEALGEG